MRDLAAKIWPLVCLWAKRAIHAANDSLKQSSPIVGSHCVTSSGGLRGLACCQAMQDLHGIPSILQATARCGITQSSYCLRILQ